MHLQKKHFSDYLPLVVILVAFVIIKIPHLYYPHFWDEAWSYAPAVELMYKHGPTLLPGSIDVEASRGHPLFFYASTAAWLKIFGNTVFAKHCFALFISVAQLATIYLFCQRLFNRRIAIAATIFLAAQVTFYVQSAMMLPEIMVGLLALLTIYFYVTEKYLWTFLWMSLLFMTKESGWVMGVVLGVDAVISFFKRSIPLPERLKKLGCVGGGGMVIAIFFLVQHHAYGWYLYPGHTGMIENTWPAVFEKTRKCMYFLFVADKLARVFWLLLVLAVAAAIWKRQWAWLFYLLPAIPVWQIVTDRATYISAPLFLGMLTLLFVAAIIISARLWAGESSAKRFLVLGGSFFIAYVIFYVFNVWIHRYLLAAMVWGAIYMAVWMDVAISRISLYLYIPVTILIGLNFFKAFQWNTGIEDSNIQAFNAMKVQKELIHYLENKNAYDKYIGVGPYQQVINLTHPETGFLRYGKTFKHAGWDISGKTDYAIFDNIEPDFRMEAVMADSNYELSFQTEHGEAWGKVYARKK